MRWCRKGLPFMMMYITGATRRLRNPGCKGACIFCLPLGHLETLYCGTTPGSQSQVEPHLCTIRGWLRRSLRLQQRRHLIGQPGSQRGPLPHLQLRPVPDPPRGPYPAPQPGLQQGRRREYQYFGAIADLKTFELLGDCRTHPTSGINRERSTHNNQLGQSTCRSHALSRKGRSVCLLLTRHSAQL